MNPPLTNMGPAWPSMPRIEPLTTPLAQLKHDPHCSYVLRGGGDCDCVVQIPHNVEPPIERAAHLQEMIRGLRRDRDMYRKLLEDTERTLADYEVMAGVPF